MAAFYGLVVRSRSGAPETFVAPMNRKQVIFVIGMCRSGSSALTRTVSLCGANLPERLLGCGRGNPKGHWEPLDALQLNDRILIENSANWYDPTLRLQRGLVFNHEKREQYLEMIRAFLDGCPERQLLIVKEPRITALTEFWFEAACRAGITVKIIIPLRHPNEVAASLAVRDSLPSELSDVLWLKYNLLAERRSRSLPRVFVEYSNLLGNWRKEITRINEGLSLDLCDPETGEIDSFLSQDLYHERCRGAPRDVFRRPWISTVYATLSAAARGEAVNTKLIDNGFDAFGWREKAFRVALNQFHAMFPDLTPSFWSRACQLWLGATSRFATTPCEKSADRFRMS